MEQKQVSNRLLKNISMKYLEELNNLSYAEKKLVSSEQRKKNPHLDKLAAQVDQSRLRMMRTSRNLQEMAELLERPSVMKEECDIVQLAEEVCEEVGDLAEYRGVRVRFFSAQSSHTCLIHAEHIRHVCYQLISNAMKFTPMGGDVRMTLNFPRHPDTVELSVIDTGCGMEQKQLSKLFNYAEEEEDAHNFFGTEGGLGLALCQKIAEVHGGSMSVESTLGKGSKFTLSFPEQNSHIKTFRQRNFYTPEGGINPALLFLSDALPADAFRIDNQL